MYSIDDFWVKRLQSLQDPGSNLTIGWEVVRQGMPTYVEAPLTWNTAISSARPPEESPIILVSAPGAVGKSTLAAEIAARTGAVYINLAKADAVGGNTLSGGIRRSNLAQLWDDGKAAVLIDALDEARLRVTHEAFEDFLENVAQEATHTKAH